MAWFLCQWQLSYLKICRHCTYFLQRWTSLHLVERDGTFLNLNSWSLAWKKLFICPSNKFWGKKAEPTFVLSFYCTNKCTMYSHGLNGCKTKHCPSFKPFFLRNHHKKYFFLRMIYHYFKTQMYSSALPHVFMCETFVCLNTMM